MASWNLSTIQLRWFHVRISFESKVLTLSICLQRAEVVCSALLSSDQTLVSYESSSASNPRRSLPARIPLLHPKPTPGNPMFTPLVMCHAYLTWSFLRVACSHWALIHGSTQSLPAILSNISSTQIYSFELNMFVQIISKAFQYWKQHSTCSHWR